MSNHERNKTYFALALALLLPVQAMAADVPVRVNPQTSVVDLQKPARVGRNNRRALRRMGGIRRNTAYAYCALLAGAAIALPASGQPAFAS
jgi:hypothetical protein